jgi:hypothetical protein
MGLPNLTLTAELGTTWGKILEEIGLLVSLDETEKKKIENNISKRVHEVPWRVGDKNAELRIIEATLKDGNGEVHIVFMPFKNNKEHQLFLIVKRILVAKGAIIGMKKGQGKTE